MHHILTDIRGIEYFQRIFNIRGNLVRSVSRIRSFTFTTQPGPTLQGFSKVAAVVESLLTNGAAIASRCFVLLVCMFTHVMFLEVVSSVKASVTHFTRKAARLTMNGLSVPLQRFLASERFDAKVAHSHLSVFLGRWRWW